MIGWKFVGRRGQTQPATAGRPAAEAFSLLEMAAVLGHFGHWRVDLATRELEWSAGMFRIHGVSSQEFQPSLKTMAALYHPEDRPSVTAKFAAALANPGGFEIKARIRRPDSELRHVVLHAETGGGALIGVMVDVTEQKVAEARMREANQVALQANAALKDMVMEDSLTGLASRRQFDLSLVHEFKRAIRSNLPLGLVLADFDYFQHYNAQYGNDAGDVSLRRAAQAIKTVPRRTGDMVARYGGEEIALLLPLADLDGAVRVAETILKAVQSLRILHEGSESGFLTISCGVAAFATLADLNNPLELVRRADQALYKAKSEGRNRVARHEPELPGDAPQAPVLAQDMERFLKSRV